MYSIEKKYNTISYEIVYLIEVGWLVGLWCLMPLSTISSYLIESKGETIHRMYRNRDYFGDGSVHDTWRPLMIQTI